MEQLHQCTRSLALWQQATAFVSKYFRRNPFPVSARVELWKSTTWIGKERGTKVRGGRATVLTTLRLPRPTDFTLVIDKEVVFQKLPNLGSNNLDGQGPGVIREAGAQDDEIGVDGTSVVEEQAVLVEPYQRGVTFNSDLEDRIFAGQCLLIRSS